MTASTSSSRPPLSSIIAPVVAWLALVFLSPDLLGGAAAALLFAALVAAVFAGVHHAEVIAHKVGEPFGALVLAVAVTVIETALIVSIMLSAPETSATLARDSVFSVVMIVLNGIVGVSVVLGATRQREQTFRSSGTRASLAVLVTLVTLVLVLPAFTLSAPGPLYSTLQLAFVSVVSVALYAVFLFVQTVRHRDFFLPPSEGVPGGEAVVHMPPPSNRLTLASVILLPVALAAVVWLAKGLAPAMEAAARAIAAPQPAAIVGALVAGLVLLPEGVAAARAARRGRLQTSLNLALGSGLATIALTIPVVAVVMLWLGRPLVLAAGPKEMVLLALTFLVSALTLGTGRVTVLQGAVHLVIFAVFAFLLWAP